jgi:hypothetical protein
MVSLLSGYGHRAYVGYRLASAGQTVNSSKRIFCGIVQLRATYAHALTQFRGIYCHIFFFRRMLAHYCVSEITGDVRCVEGAGVELDGCPRTPRIGLRITATAAAMIHCVILWYTTPNVTVVFNDSLFIA